MFMDVFFGSKRVCGIYQGDKAIHGIMIDSKLYPGGIGMVWATRPSSGPDDWLTLDSWQKVYYNHIVHSGYGITLYGAQAYHTTVSSGGVFRVGEWNTQVMEGWTLDPVIGSAINTTVKPGGKFFIGGEDGIGFAENVTISSGGTMYVHSGCSALNVTSKNGAQLTVFEGAHVTYT
jgi:autotransporter passenger strand-loop-strand repeat protein